MRGIRRSTVDDAPVPLTILCSVFSRPVSVLRYDDLSIYTTDPAASHPRPLRLSCTEPTHPAVSARDRRRCIQCRVRRLEPHLEKHFLAQKKPEKKRTERNELVEAEIMVEIVHNAHVSNELVQLARRQARWVDFTAINYSHL